VSMETGEGIREVFVLGIVEAETDWRELCMCFFWIR
jgi:hypothetical protein